MPGEKMCYPFDLLGFLRKVIQQVTHHGYELIPMSMEKIHMQWKSQIYDA